MIQPVGTNHKHVLPLARYVDLFLPDGTHSGVRVDVARGMLEVQRKGKRHYFDLALFVTQGIDKTEKSCYATT